jgi:transposase InsO family protein
MTLLGRDDQRALQGRGDLAPALLASASAVEMATLRWVDWYNNQRLFGPIGYIPPAEAEANYYAALENLNMAA